MTESNTNMKKKIAPIHTQKLATSCIWFFNAFLIGIVLSLFGGDFLKGSFLEYKNIEHKPFDGVVSPIAYIPDYNKEQNKTNKMQRYENFPIESFIEIPKYTPENLIKNNQETTIDRYVYIVPYMGSYRMNGKEYDGSHLGVDIRAPLGTPVRSIANGVVVDVNTTETGVGKYIVIRHDGVLFEGKVGSYYSNYLHLEEIAVKEGMLVNKGDFIGRVGLTGITTTPHLHFQIDTEDALYHPYWPFSSQEARNAGLDFFSAINVGIGKEKALIYSVHPMDFLGEARNAVEETTPKIIVATNSNLSDIGGENILTLNSAPEEKKTLEYFLGTGDGEPITRAQALKSLFEIFKISTPEYGFSDYKDVFPSEPYSGVVEVAQKLGIIQSKGFFYPESPITRVELALMLVRLGKFQKSSNTIHLKDTETLSEEAKNAAQIVSEILNTNDSIFQPLLKVEIFGMELLKKEIQKIF